MGQRRGARLGSVSFQKLFKLRRWLPGALAVAAGLTGPVDLVRAQPTMPVMPAPGTPGTVAPAATATPAAAPEKVIEFLEFDKADWGNVLDWYAKESELTMITTVKPTGSVTMKPGKGRKFTMAEITDLINETMAQQKFILIRRHMTFFIHPADEPIDPTLVPRIELNELPKRGRTEIVQVILPIKGMVVADAQDELKRLLTPFGKMFPLDKSNSILIMDTVGNIVRIKNVLEEAEGKNDSDSLNHVLQYRRAQEVAETLKLLLSDKDTKIELTGTQNLAAPAMNPPFGGGNFGGGNFGGGNFGGGGNRGFGGQGGNNNGNNPPATNARVKTVQIAVDARRNAILVTAPQDKIGLAKRLIEEQDKPLRPGDAPYRPAEPVLKTYSVQVGAAAELAKTVEAKLPWLRVIPLVQQNQIMVLGAPEDQIEVTRLLGLDQPGGAVAKTEFISLSVLEPGEAAATLTKQLPTPQAGGPSIEASKTGPNTGLLITGTEAHIASAKHILKLLGETNLGGSTQGSNPNSRTIDFGGGNAAVMAELFAELLAAKGKKVIIIDPLNPPRQTPAPTPGPQPSLGNTPPKPSLSPPPAPMKVPGVSEMRQPLAGRDFQFTSAQIVDPEKDKPVTITVAGGRLLIQSEDTQVLEVLATLAKYYTQKPTDPNAENLFKVIPLKYISSEDAARELTEIFNGPQQQQQRGGGGGLFGGGGGGGGLNPLALLGLGGGGAPAAPTPGRIRVVAEKSSNSLIVVKATPIDLLLIQKLLAVAIDGGRTDSAAVLKTFVVPLKNADATEMSTVLKGVYKSAMATTGGNQQVGAFPFLAQPQQQGQTRPPALSIQVDDRSNSLVLLCAETLYEEIKLLVDTLDNATVSTTEVTQLVKLKGVDPNVVQQAINALQGRDTRNQGVGGFGGGRGGQGGMGGGGLGGGGLGGGGLGGGGFPGGGLGGGGFGGGGFPGGGLGGGGGFPGGGGGGFGGMGGGGFGGMGGGGMGGGGGGRGGGGGGRGGGGGGGRIGMGPSGEGYSNFDYRGMDVPSAPMKLYDPATDVADLGYNRPAAPKSQNEIAQAGGRQPGPIVPGGPLPPPPMTDPRPPFGAPPGTGGPGTGPAVVGGTGAYGGAAPRGTVSAIPVGSLDSVIIRATEPGDLKIVLDLIAALQAQSEGTQPKLELVYLDHGDCNYIADTLNSIFSRVTIGQSGNYVPQAARNPQNAALAQLGGGVSPTQNVYCIAVPRFNAILIAAPEARFNDVVREMRRLLDQPNSAPLKAFKLKKASAQIVASQLQNFWNSRYPGEALVRNQFRVTFDVANNTVYLQGSPGDLRDAEDLIAMMDQSSNLAFNDMRVFFLRNALADELGQILSNALTANVVSPLVQSQQTGPVAQQAGGAAGFLQGVGLGGIGGQIGGGQIGGGQLGNIGANLGGGGANLGGGGAGLGATQVRNINAIIPTIGQGVGGGLVTKTSAIRFFSAVRRDPQTGQLIADGKTYETGYLEDVHIVSNARINALIVAAPTATMQLIEKLIDNMDTVAAARSYVNVYKLVKADANLTANLLAQLFTGQGRQTTTGIGANAGGLGTTNTARPLLVLTGNPSDGASLIDLRLSVDDRTNSLIVAGSLNDLNTINAVVKRLEDADVSARYNEVVKLRNAAAADVATAVQTFFTNALASYTGPGYTSIYLQLQRNVVVVAEPVSNTVLISATPEYFGQIRMMIDRIDAQPPQVMIQVLIAEVQLNNDQELGAELGLQSPVLFDRGISSATTYTPGFNFNTTAALPNSSLANARTVGFQGLTNLGVGRSSASQGVGGFVFSASSTTFSLLIRALQTQGRVDILSRPQLQVADNQTGFVQVGQNYPYLSGSTLTATGASQQSISYEPTGVTMRVTPRVNPDGKVLMRVEPQVESVSSSPVSLSSGVQAPVFNVETVQTTVLASDGETIVLGGLISKQETRQENGVPYMKDIPYIGALFRYRTHSIARREVLIIMTPHIVRSEFDNARILAEEAAKLKMCLPEIAAVHTHGMEIIGPAAHGARPVLTNPQGGPGGPNFVPGPAYFGNYDSSQMNGAPAFPPGTVPPAAIQPGLTPPGFQPGGMPPPAAIQPGYGPSGTVPGGMPPQAGVPSQPFPTTGGQPGAAGYPQPGPHQTQPVYAPPVPLSGPIPGAAAPQLWPTQPASGFIPVSSAQPTFSGSPATGQVAPISSSQIQPVQAQQGAPPAAPVPLSYGPQTCAPPGYAVPQTCAQPGYFQAPNYVHPTPPPTFAMGPPAGATPTYAPPVQAQPGFVPMALPPGSPGYPMANPSMAAVPAVAPSRGFQMMGGQVPQQQVPQPVPGKDAPPANVPANTTKEGKSWVDGNN